MGRPGQAGEIDVDAKSRCAVATKLRRLKRPWAEIAAQCDYPSTDACKKAVLRALRKELSGEIEQWRDEELDTLAALQAAVMPLAIREFDVDLAAVDRVLAIVDKRARFLGLFVQSSDGAGAVPIKRQYVGAAVEEV